MLSWNNTANNTNNTTTENNGILGWFSSLWTSEYFTGPARNAPNQGRNIKALFDQRPKQVINVSQEQIQSIKSSLKPTIINEIPPIKNPNPTIKELNNVYDIGPSEFLAQIRAKRQQKILEIINSPIDDSQTLSIQSSETI